MTHYIIDQRPRDLTDEGWVLVQNVDGEHWIEYAYAVEDGKLFPWTQVPLYRVQVPDDVYKEFNWAATINLNDPPSETDLERGRSSDVTVRAWEVVNLGELYGWEELDNYPLHLSAQELAARWDLDAVEVPLDDIPDQEFVTRHLYLALRAARAAPRVDFGRAMTRAMARVAKTLNKNIDGTWGAAECMRALQAVTGKHTENERLVVVAVDFVGLTAKSAGLNISHPREDRDEEDTE